MTVFIGRRESVGVAIETTAGTSAAPQTWQRHLALTLDQKTTTAKNTSAMGRIEDINDSAVTEEWAEGSINGKVCDLSVGYFLSNMFGTCSAALHAGETTVWDNTFTTNQTNAPNTLTFVRKNDVVNRRYALGMLSDFQLEVKTGDWAMFTSTLSAKVGATGSDTVAFVTENEFTSKHVVVKNASTTGGLAGATALALKSLKLKIERKADKFVPFGSIDPTSYDTGEFKVTGELQLRYDAATLEALGLANTRQALSIAMTNTDTTIGSAANPTLTFTMPKVRLAPITLDNNLSTVMTQTILFTAEFDTSVSAMITAVLTNTQNGYAHA